MALITTKTMDNIFYYLGAIYILNLCYRFYKTLYPNKKNDNEAKEFLNDFSKIMPQDIHHVDESHLKNTTNQLKKAGSGNVIKFIKSMVYLGWIITGYLYYPESTLFLIMIIISVVSFLVPIIYIIMSLFDNNKSMPKALMDTTSAVHDSKFITIINITDITVKIMATGFIIYPHIIF